MTLEGPTIRAGAMVATLSPGAALLDDITTHQSSLAAHTLNGTHGDVSSWLSQNSQFAHSWRATIEDAQHAAVPDFSMFAMTCRKLNDLCRGLIAGP